MTALEAVPNEHADYVFWDGRSERETTLKSWNRDFRKLFSTATPPMERGHPHRFRDTFAVSLLLKGVSLESVSKLLGPHVDQSHGATLCAVRQGATRPTRS